MFWPLFLPVIKGFDHRFYQRSKVLTAVTTAALGMGCRTFLLPWNFESCFYQLSRVWGAMLTSRIKIPTDCAGVTENGNICIKRVRLNYLTNQCPALPSHTKTYRLICLPTRLLSHRTLTLNLYTWDWSTRVTISEREIITQVNLSAEIVT